jgi:hypothetical protein
LNRIGATPKDSEAEPAEADAGEDRPSLVGRIAARLGLKREVSRSDAALAGLGVALALVCALFPWYIFFNQDQFGIRALKFQGNQSRDMPSSLAPQPSLVGQPMTVEDLPAMDIDILTTATMPGRGEGQEEVPLSEQPFPGDLIEYRLVHVANGRAMIEDDDGLWVVQPGSLLPDASRVASIEQRDGRWVILTTHDRVVEMEN